MAGIDTSQPMSKITLHKMLLLERHYYIKNLLRAKWWNFGKLRGHGGGVSAACEATAKKDGSDPILTRRHFAERLDGTGKM